MGPPQYQWHNWRFFACGSIRILVSGVAGNKVLGISTCTVQWHTGVPCNTTLRIQYRITVHVPLSYPIPDSVNSGKWERSISDPRQATGQERCYELITRAIHIVDQIAHDDCFSVWTIVGKGA